MEHHRVRNKSTEKGSAPTLRAPSLDYAIVLQNWSYPRATKNSILSSPRGPVATSLQGLYSAKHYYGRFAMQPGTPSDHGGE